MVKDVTTRQITHSQCKVSIIKLSYMTKAVMGIQNTVLSFAGTSHDPGFRFGGTPSSRDGDTPNDLANRDSDGAHLRGELHEEVLAEVCTERMGDKSTTNASSGNIGAVVVDMDRDSC